MSVRNPNTKTEGVLSVFGRFNQSFGQLKRWVHGCCPDRPSGSARVQLIYTYRYFKFTGDRQYGRGGGGGGGGVGGSTAHRPLRGPLRPGYGPAML